MNARPLLTIAQIVEQFELSRATVRRGIESGRFNDARKDQQGRWLVPVESLVAEGIKPRKSWLKDVASEPAHERGQPVQVSLNPNQDKVASELAHIENALAHERIKVAHLEAQLEAEKRLREASERNAEDLRSAMRMLEAAPAAPAPRERRRWTLWK